MNRSNYHTIMWAMLWAGLTLLNVACGNRTDAIKTLNDAPNISKIFVGGKTLKPSPNPLEDSLKNSLKVNQKFELSLEVSDANRNLSQVSVITVGEPKGRFWINNNEPLTSGKSWTVGKSSNQIKLAYEPKTGVLGRHEFEVVFTDKLGASTSQKIALVCFDNTPPVAQLKANFTGPDPRQYQLDMSASRDSDHKHGGRVLFYHIKVNNRSVITETLAKIPYIFNAGAGTYLIEYWVTDNDGEESEKKSLSLEIK